MNHYIEIKHAFKFLECATRQKEMLTRCGSLPDRLGGRNSVSDLRDYIYGPMLVSVIAQLEHDIEYIHDIPLLHRTDKLARRLIILRDHFRIGVDAFDAVDRIREARNNFVHNGMISSDAGCTKAEMPGHLVTFLQRCNHTDYP